MPCFDTQILYQDNQCTVLGILFDNKLQWHCQVTRAMKKAKKSLHAIRLVTVPTTHFKTKFNNLLSLVLLLFTSGNLE